MNLDASRHDPLEQRIDSVHVVLTEAGTRLYPVNLRYAFPGELDLMARLAGLVERARRATELPLYAGFGISTPGQAAAAAALADGIVVGSRALEVAEEGPAALGRYVRSLRDSLD